MNRIPRIMSITELRTNQTEIVDSLKDGPIVLTRQGRAAAVLVHPQQWNDLIQQVEDMKRKGDRNG